MEYRGHQIFIFHPEPDIRESLVSFLRDQEYETFGFDTTEPLELDRHRESIVFLAPGDESGDWDCSSLVEHLSADQRSVHFVALAGTPVPDCFDLAIDADGEGLNEAILDYLENTHARGHRHYVRFGSQNASIATFEHHDDQKRYAGIIHDISVRGLSCTYRPEPGEQFERRIREMHLNLPGHRCVVSGTLTSQRKVAGQVIHVFMFDRDMPNSVLHDLHDYIYRSLSMKLSAH